MNAVDKYINRIRNDNKRAYARLYAAWVSRGRVGVKPYQRGLSVMAMQAVQMEINELTRGDNWTVGLCRKCGDGHSLINGLCYDCRPIATVGETCTQREAK